MEYARDVLVSLSAVAVVIFAWLGLRTWRKELVGRARFETARRMWRSVSECKDNFEWVRNPLMKSPEWADRAPQASETGKESEVLNTWYAKNKRLNLIRESLNKVTEIRWEAEILFDDASVQLINKAVQSYTESYANISSAISDFYEITLDEARTSSMYRNQEYLKELKKIIFSAQGDEISKKIYDATAILSQILKQYVR